jgi:hypothetical protein
MKNIICFFILALGIVSCSSDDNDIKGEFKFVTEYSTIVTVGGFVGIRERVFKVGEIYNGTDKGKETIRIRIAEHSELNDDCPNSWCYQEFLDVPREFLKFTE